MKHKIINCIICGKEVRQTHTKQKTCGSKECKLERKQGRNLDRWHEKKEYASKRRKFRYDKDSTREKERAKINYEKNKEKKKKQTLEYYHKMYKADEGFKMRRKLGTALGDVIRHYIKTGKVANPMRKYYIDWEGIMEVLTPIPKPRSKYNVDHIIPLCKFDLTDFRQIHLAFAPENHRWMLAKDNMSRSKLRRNKMSKKDVMKSKKKSEVKSW